ncbi:MAG: helix-turn-helix transcriptional regulator [Oscillospiraceae bacterium]
MKQRGLTQGVVAYRMKLSQPAINQKINGKRGLRLDEAYQFAQILQIGKNEFLDLFFLN